MATFATACQGSQPRRRAALFGRACHGRRWRVRSWAAGVVVVATSALVAVGAAGEGVVSADVSVTVPEDPAVAMAVVTPRPLLPRPGASPVAASSGSSSSGNEDDGGSGTDASDGGVKKVDGGGLQPRGHGAQARGGGGGSSSLHLSSPSPPPRVGRAEPVVPGGGAPRRTSPSPSPLPPLPPPPPPLPSPPPPLPPPPPPAAGGRLRPTRPPAPAVTPARSVANSSAGHPWPSSIPRGRSPPAGTAPRGSPPTETPITAGGVTGSFPPLIPVTLPPSPSPTAAPEARTRPPPPPLPSPLPPPLPPRTSPQTDVVATASPSPLIKTPVPNHGDAVGGGGGPVGMPPWAVVNGTQGVATLGLSITTAVPGASTQSPPPLTPELAKAVAVAVAAATETDPSAWALTSEEPSRSSHDGPAASTDASSPSARTSKTDSSDRGGSDGAEVGAQQLCTLVTTFPAAAAADVNRSLTHLESYIQEGQLDEDLATIGDASPLLVRVERGPTLLLRTPQAAPLGPSESATAADGSGLSASKLTGIVVGALAGATTLVVAAVVLGGAALRRHAAVARDGHHPSRGGGGGAWGGGGIDGLRSAGYADGSGGGAGSSAASSTRRPFDGSSAGGFGEYVPPANTGAVRGLPESPPVADTYGGSPDYGGDYGGWEGEAPAFSPPSPASLATGNEAVATWAASAAAATTAARPPRSLSYPDGASLVGTLPPQTPPPPATPAAARWDSPASDGGNRGPAAASPPSSPYVPPSRGAGLPLVGARGEVGSLARPPSGRSMSGGLPSGPSDMSAGSVCSGISVGGGGDPLIAAAAAGHLVRSPSGERGRRVVSSFAGRPPPPPVPAPLAPLLPSGSESSSMAESDASGTPRSSLASSEGSSVVGGDAVPPTVAPVSGEGDETDGSASAASAYYENGPVGAGGSRGGGGAGRSGHTYQDSDGANTEMDADVDDTFGDAELSGDLAGGWDAPPPSMAPARFRRPLVAGAAVPSTPKSLAAHELNPLAVLRSVGGGDIGSRMRPSASSSSSSSSSSSHGEAVPTGKGTGGRRAPVDTAGRAGSFATPSSEGSTSSDGLWAPDPPPPPSMRVVGRASGVPPGWQREGNF